MVSINRIPNVIIHGFITGASITGVDPEGDDYSFNFDNNIGVNFTVDEEITWTGGTGYLISLVDNGLTGSMLIALATGVPPSDGLTITGSSSGATCDVDGDVTNYECFDSSNEIRRGRYRQFCGLLDGGLITIPESVAWNGYKVRGALFTLPGITALNIFVVTRDGHDVFAGSPTVTSGNAYHDWRDEGLLIAPGCKLKVIGTGTLTDLGRIMFILDKGWAASTFDLAPSLGEESRPPGMDRP